MKVNRDLSCARRAGKWPIGAPALSNAELERLEWALLIESICHDVKPHQLGTPIVGHPLQVYGPVTRGNLSSAMWLMRAYFLTSLRHREFRQARLELRLYVSLWLAAREGLPLRA